MSSKSQSQHLEWFTHQNPDLWGSNDTLLGLDGKFTSAVLMFCQRIDFNIDRTPIHDQFFLVPTGLPIATYSQPPLHIPLEVTNQLGLAALRLFPLTTPIYDCFSHKSKTKLDSASLWINQPETDHYVFKQFSIWIHIAPIWKSKKNLSW